MCVSVVDHGRRSSPAGDRLRGLHWDCSVFQAGRGHGEFRNPLIIRYYLNESVETQPFLGHVSTLYFVNHWKSVSPENKRGRVPTACSGGNRGDVCVDLGRAPAWVKPLEVRCAHPVRLAPATHSQGHGRPCLQRSHPSQGFSVTWSLLMVIFLQCNSPCVLKRFSRTSWPKFDML